MNLVLKDVKKEPLRLGQKKDWMIKKNLFFFFSYDINKQDLAKSGMSIGTSTSESFNVETDTCYHYTKFGKASLKFSKYLEPTKEFTKAVRPFFLYSIQYNLLHL